ncbi:hypothetical protein BJ138DRAFT_1114507 [Hygrophoropsis aurantiaca]|uniref:Uncharacterized protein n=1 Tax=Hygrophoropsis aurantiaca TaxID=72124 RepID=A0ACB8A970_9AGAM|nr:hypothetical protein BJ138DRAFT_1114507 [Hygrophoropsis aurantiaca]
MPSYFAPQTHAALFPTGGRQRRPSTPVTRPSSTLPAETIQHARQNSQQWLTAARQSAVPFEHDRNGFPLYIARALIEGEIHIGKASTQLTGGALINNGGRERTIAKYEVLVCASQLRWDVSEHTTSHISYPQGTVVLTQQESRHTLRVEDISRVILKVDHREEGLKRLAEIKTVILVDDSLSMEGALWEQAREALSGVADLANKYGSKGIDLFFLHQDEYFTELKTKHAVEELFDSVLPNGADTPTASKLEQIFNTYLPFLEAKNSDHEPITIIVLTDGVATDHEDLAPRIVEAARRLEMHHIAHNRFGIQFVQIGDEEDAAEALRELDDGLAERYQIRDIVDATPFDPVQRVFNTDYMVKILLGSLNKDLDNLPTPSSSQSLVDSRNFKPFDSLIPPITPQPLAEMHKRRSSLTTTVSPQSYMDTHNLKRLAHIKTVILLDDSLSMEGVLWAQAREALSGVVETVNRYEAKGIDLFFLHNARYQFDLKSKQDVEDIFQYVTPEGEDTPTAFKLGQLIDHYIPILAQNPSQEPISIIVITDGAASDHQDLPNKIVNAARRLEHHSIPQGKFSIQFVQIGEDKEASLALRRLDDNLSREHRIKDIVDTTPFYPGQGAFDTEYMLKILLGGIDKVLDNSTNSGFSSSGYSPRVSRHNSRLSDHAILPLMAPVPSTPPPAPFVSGVARKGSARKPPMKPLVELSGSFNVGF